MLTAFRVNSHSGRRFAFGNLRRFLVRTAATTTASLHPPTRRQPKVDKTPDGPIIDVVSMIRGDDITARNNGRFSKFPVIFPVLRENGILVGSCRSLNRLAAKVSFLPRCHMQIRRPSRCDNHDRRFAVREMAQLMLPLSQLLDLTQD